MSNRWEDVERQREEEAQRKAQDRQEAEELAKNLGKTVKRLRTEKKVSQEEFAYVVGVHRTYMGLVERGEHNVSVHTARQIAIALGLTLSSLFARVEAEWE